MAPTDSFCLQWNGFGSHLSEAFSDIREDKDLFDVTLACEDNQIEAHKLILSACSTFFRSIFKSNPHRHPLLYLRGVKFKELLGILNFMYMGQVSVAEADLNSFLSVAADLKIRGLTQPTETSLEKKPCSPKIKTEKENGHSFKDVDGNIVVKNELNNSFNSIEDENPVVSKSSVDFQPVKRAEEPGLEPIVTIHHHPEDDNVEARLDMSSAGLPVDWDNCYADLSMDWNELVEEKMTKRENIWHCMDCDYTTRNKTSLISHVQGKHIDSFPGYICKICGGRSGTYCGFEKHMSRQHKYSLARKTTM